MSNKTEYNLYLCKSIYYEQKEKYIDVIIVLYNVSLTFFQYYRYVIHLLSYISLNSEIIETFLVTITWWVNLLIRHTYVRTYIYDAWKIHTYMECFANVTFYSLLYEYIVLRYNFFKTFSSCMFFLKLYFSYQLPWSFSIHSVLLNKIFLLWIFFLNLRPSLPVMFLFLFFLFIFTFERKVSYITIYYL